MVIGGGGRVDDELGADHYLIVAAALRTVRLVAGVITEV